MQERLGNIYTSLHLALKYVRILVRGHYLLRDVISFPRAKLQENPPLQIGYFYTTSWN